jgi:hypothetical protein
MRLAKSTATREEKRQAYDADVNARRQTAVSDRQPSATVPAKAERTGDSADVSSQEVTPQDSSPQAEDRGHADAVGYGPSLPDHDPALPSTPLTYGGMPQTTSRPASRGNRGGQGRRPQTEPRTQPQADSESSGDGEGANAEEPRAAEIDRPSRHRGSREHGSREDKDGGQVDETEPRRRVRAEPEQGGSPEKQVGSEAKDESGQKLDRVIEILTSLQRSLEATASSSEVIAQKLDTLNATMSRQTNGLK